jgi:GR25 family glycosyltransferase involved in LPS biosynthesis
MQYNAYVISLNNPNKLLSKISKYNLNTILINGVNGSKLSSLEINQNTKLLCSMFCPKSAIGIGMSHIKSWKEFIKSKKKLALFFEDDVVFVNNFRQKLDNAIENTPNDFDILYLGCFGCNDTVNIFTLMGSGTGIINLNASYINNYVKKPEISLATHSYVLTRKGAKKLIKCIDNNIYYHIDYMMQYLIRNNQINAYSLNKRIVYQTSTDNTMSTNNNNTHPIVITNLLSNYYIDTKVKASYIANLTFMRVGDLNLSLFSIIFLISSIILSTTNIDIYKISCFYILLSSPDIYINPNNIMILIHYLLLIIPYLIIKYINFWSYFDKN